MDNSNAARPLPYCTVYSTRILLQYCTRTAKYNTYRTIEPTTVPTVLRFPLLTTYYLLSTTCYYLLPATRLLPTTSCLLPTAYYLLPATY